MSRKCTTINVMLELNEGRTPNQECYVISCRHEAMSTSYIQRISNVCLYITARKRGKVVYNGESFLGHGFFNFVGKN